MKTTPMTIYPLGNRTGTHCKEGSVGPTAGLDGCENPRATEIRSADRPARSESLVRNRNAYKILIWTPKFKKLLRTPRHKCHDNSEVNIKQIGCESVDWLMWLGTWISAFVTNRQVPHRLKNFFVIYQTINFTFHGVTSVHNTVNTTPKGDTKLYVENVVSSWYFTRGEATYPVLISNI